LVKWKTNGVTVEERNGGASDLFTKGKVSFLKEKSTNAPRKCLEAT
jgi:hypothetical protein